MTIWPEIDYLKFEISQEPSMQILKSLAHLKSADITGCNSGQCHNDLFLGHFLLIWS